MKLSTKQQQAIEFYINHKNTYGINTIAKRFNLKQTSFYNLVKRIPILEEKKVVTKPEYEELAKAILKEWKKPTPEAPQCVLRGSK